MIVSGTKLTLARGPVAFDSHYFQSQRRMPMRMRGPTHTQIIVCDPHLYTVYVDILLLSIITHVHVQGVRLSHQSVSLDTLCHRYITHEK